MKRLVVEKYADSCGRFLSLLDFREAIEVDGDSAVVVRDGNVMLMSMPSSAVAFSQMVDVAERSLLQSLRTASTVCVCFDAPEHVPIAKVETQRKRDCAGYEEAEVGETNGREAGRSVLSRADSEWFAQQHDCRPLLKSRETRYRLFDAVMRRTVDRIRASHRAAESWSRGEAEREGAWRASRPLLLVEGVDPFEPPSDADPGSRRPGLLCTGDLNEAAARLGIHVECEGTVLRCRETCRVGEADLKLRLVAEAATTAERPPRLLLIDTIDTDVLPILLTSDRLQGARAEVGVFVVMRERGKHAKAALQEELDLSEPPETAGWLVVDARHLHASIAGEIPTLDTWTSTRLVGMCWAACGCDFVFPSIPASDSLHASLIRTLRDASDSHRVVEQLRVAFERAEESESSRAALCDFVRRAAERAGREGEVSVRTSRALIGIPDLSLRRALWTTLYWSNAERPPSDSASLGF